MAEKNQKSSDVEMTFFEHIEDLRPHLVRAALALVVIAIIAFVFKGFIIDTLLFAPQTADFPTNRWFCSMGHKLADFTAWFGSLFNAEWHTDPDVLCINRNNSFPIVNMKVAGQFSLHLKVAMITGLVLGIPYFLWEIWQFVKPALSPKERAGTRMFVLYVSLGFFVGLLFGYYIVTPFSLHFFLNYHASDAIENFISINDYFSHVIGISLGTSVIFQLPLLIYFLTRIGILNSQMLRKYRRHAVIVLALVASFITPPDLFSMILVMFPLYGLYEFSILLSSRTEKKYYREEAEENSLTTTG